MINIRSAGMILPIFSLPSKEGIGTFGDGAHKFLEFLNKTGQTYWQILPIGPIDEYNSPYMSWSSSGGNYLFIDLAELQKKGLTFDTSAIQGNPRFVDYKTMKREKRNILEKMYKKYSDYHGKNENYLQRQKHWLIDFAQFQWIREEFGTDIKLWPEKYLLRDSKTLDEILKEDQFWYYVFEQYLFFQQWENLKAHSRKLGITIIGDLPFYSPLSSIEVWRHPNCFAIDKNWEIQEFSGAPPDDFNVEGQNWGSPCYAWENIKEEKFAYWLNRLERQFSLFDLVRLDHFRGFEAYWSIPESVKGAREGHWVKAPGEQLFTLGEQLWGKLPVIVEDLGALTKEFEEFFDKFSYPGMNILQFAFGDEVSKYLPHNHKSKSISCSGTHDNLPLPIWWETATEKERHIAKSYLGLNNEEGEVEGLIRGVYSSVSFLALVQFQDFLTKEMTGRVNTPGSKKDNWEYRVTENMFQQDLEKRVKEMVKRYGREHV